jgi:hypothetical protein
MLTYLRFYNMTLETKLTSTFQNYHQPKPEGEIDLVNEVYEILVQSGLKKNIAAYTEDRRIKEAQGKGAAIQRFLLNSYWTLQLMSASQPSIEERYCLIPNGEIEDWLKLFKARIVPFLVSNNLPKAIV